MIVDGVPQVGPPKSAAGVRTIALDELTVELLRRLWRAQREARPGAGMDSPMFTYGNGRPVRPDWLTRRLPVLAAKAGLPPVRLHDLRHGTASLEAAAGARLKATQEDLGHSSILTTAGYVTILTFERHKAARDTAELVHSHARRRMSLAGASQA